jgi:thiamine-phosphate pyrophosphorylase
MPWNKTDFDNLKLYLILDRGVHSYADLLRIAVEGLIGGVDIIQLRDKNGSARDILAFSKEIKRVIGSSRVPFILNDRVDLAILADADGVHVGQDDIPVREVRRLLGFDKIVGVSCQTETHIVQARDDEADYIGFGSVFSTLTKPDRQPMDLDFLERMVKSVSIPVFAIGGITADRLDILQSRGINRVAVCRAISQSAEVAGVVKIFKNALNRAT